MDPEDLQSQLDDMRTERDRLQSSLDDAITQCENVRYEWGYFSAHVEHDRDDSNTRDLDKAIAALPT